MARANHVFHAVGVLSRARRVRRTFPMIVSALAFQTNGGVCRKRFQRSRPGTGAEVEFVILVAGLRAGS